MLAGDALAAYNILRAFSWQVRLSPFAFEELCAALFLPTPSPLMDELHVSHNNSNGHSLQLGCAVTCETCENVETDCNICISTCHDGSCMPFRRLYTRLRAGRCTLYMLMQWAYCRVPLCLQTSDQPSKFQLTLV